MSRVSNLPTAPTVEADRTARQCVGHGWSVSIVTMVSLGVGLGTGLVGLAGCSSTQPSTQTMNLPPRDSPTPMAGMLRPTPQVAAPPAAPVRVAAAPVARAAHTSQSSGPAADAPAPAVPRTRGVYKVGSPYVINGQTYVPAEEPGYDRSGIGSWYGHDFHGKETANGEIFDMNALTAAHPTLPLPSYAYVTNLRNGRTILVRINDRGPYKPGRIIDLSRGSARALAFEGYGVTDVRVRYAGKAPLQPDDTQERRYLAAQAWGRSVRPSDSLGIGQTALVR